MQIVTGYTGEAHITSSQDRAINQGIVGGGSYILSTGSQMAATAASANEVRIADGVLSMQGCMAVIPEGSYDSVTITSGTAGYNRIDLIVARYTRDTSTEVETMELAVIEGTPSASTASTPTYTDGDIQAGDTYVETPLYKVWLTGVNVALTRMATLIDDTAAITADINGLQTTLQVWQGRLSTAEDDIDDLQPRMTTAESAISGMIVKKDYSYTYSIGAGAHIYVTATNLGISTPSGYTPIGVQVLWSGNANVSVMGFQGNVSGSSSFCELINNSSSAVSNATLRVSVIYVRSGSYSTR